MSNDPVWDLALVAMALQAVRHAVADSYAKLRPAVRGSGLAENVSRVAGLSRGLNNFPWTVYLRRAFTLPFGDKWLLMAVFVAFFTPRTVFVVLVTVTTIGTCYIIASRILRTRGWGSVMPPDVQGLAVIADSAILSLLFVFARNRVAWIASWRFFWLIPVLLRCLGYGAVLALALLAHSVGVFAVFCYLACVVLCQYNEVYQVKFFGHSSCRWPGLAAGGSDGRTALLLLLALAGGDVLRVALPYLTASLACLFVITMAQFWLRETSSNREAAWSQPASAGATA